METVESNHSESAVATTKFGRHRIQRVWQRFRLETARIHPNPPESTRIHPQTSISVGIYPKWNSFHESSPSNPGNFQQRCCDLPELRWWPSGRLECGYCHAINSCANEWKCANPHWPIPASTSLADSSIPPINQSINQSIRSRQLIIYESIYEKYKSNTSMRK